MVAGTEAEIDDIGFFTPNETPAAALGAGEVGYVITGIKDVTKLRVGDTLTTKRNGATEALPGYRDVQPMVYCGLFPIESDQFPELRDALEKLTLNDAALQWEPETSDALGFGFRCGFLGLLHMDIVRERLEREYDLELMATMPSVEFEVTLTDGEVAGPQPADMPDPARIAEIREPYVKASILTPKEYIGPIMELCQEKRGRARGDALPVGRPRAAELRPARCRDRPGLLRPAQVAHARLRVARLRADRPARRRTSSSSTSCSRATRSTRCR
jgi:GTP-binding protein LepA